MRCEQVWDLLSVYADNETTGDEAAIVETHIAVCSECARDLQWLQATAGALSLIPEVEPPVSLHASILAATVYRPTWQQRLQASLGSALSFRTLRYGALAGSAAMATWLAVNFAGPVAPNPAAYRPVTRTAPIARQTPAAAIPSGPSALFTARLDHNVNLDVETGRVSAAGRTVRASRVTASPAVRMAAVEATPGLKPIQPKSLSTRSLVDAGSVRTAAPNGPIAEEPSTTLDEMPMMSDMSTQPRIAESGTAKDTSADPRTAGQPMASQPMHVALASYSEPAPSTQLVTLADLKRSLRHQAMDERAQFITESIKEKRIRLDVVRGRF